MKQKKINFLDNDKYAFIRFIFFGMQVFKNFRGKNLKLIILKKNRIKSKKNNLDNNNNKILLIYLKDYFNIFILCLPKIHHLEVLQFVP